MLSHRKMKHPEIQRSHKSILKFNSEFENSYNTIFSNDGRLHELCVMELVRYDVYSMLCNFALSIVLHWMKGNSVHTSLVEGCVGH